jgi:hypothetical protein
MVFTMDSTCQLYKYTHKGEISTLGYNEITILKRIDDPSGTTTLYSLSPTKWFSYILPWSKNKDGVSFWKITMAFWTHFFYWYQSSSYAYRVYHSARKCCFQINFHPTYLHVRRKVFIAADYED